VRLLNRLLTKQAQRAVELVSECNQQGAWDDLDPVQRQKRVMAYGACLDWAATALAEGKRDVAIRLACGALNAVPDDHTQLTQELRARAKDILLRIPDIQSVAAGWWKAAADALSDMFACMEQASAMRAPLPSEFRAWEKSQQYSVRQKQLADKMMNSAFCAFSFYEYLQAVWPQQRQALVELREGISEYMRGLGAMTILLEQRSKSRKPMDEATVDLLTDQFTSCAESGRQRIEKGLSLFTP
jgi:hypothetical protein